VVLEWAEPLSPAVREVVLEAREQRPSSYVEHAGWVLADAGGGSYYYIASPEGIPGIFQEELGELGSVVAQNLRVDLAPAHARVVGILGFSDDALPAAAGDVQTGATRSVLLALDVKGVDPGDVELGTVSCTWTPLAGALVPVERTLVLSALATTEVENVEAHVDRDVLRAAQLQLVADAHQAAVEAASRRDEEGYRTQLARAEETLAQVEASDDPTYLAQKRLHEELRARGQAAALNDRNLQLRAHEVQYRTRRSRPLRSETGTGGGPGLVDRVHLLPWVDLPIPRPPKAQSSPEL